MTVVQSHTIQSKKSIANAKEEDEDEGANANEDEEDTKQCKCWLRRQIAEEIGFAGMTQTSCLVETTFDWTSPLICLRFNCAQLLSNVFPRLCFDWIWPRLGWWIVRDCIALPFTWFANFMSFQLQVVQMVHKTRLQNTVLKMQLNQLFIRLFQNQIAQISNFLVLLSAGPSSDWSKISSSDWFGLLLNDSLWSPPWAY